MRTRFFGLGEALLDSLLADLDFRFLGCETGALGFALVSVVVVFFVAAFLVVVFLDVLLLVGVEFVVMVAGDVVQAVVVLRVGALFDVVLDVVEVGVVCFVVM